MAKIMINEAKLPNAYQREVVHIAIYTLNRVHFRINSEKTPYELWYGKPASIKYFKVFGSEFYIMREEDNF